jgi:FkbM family methyltransferase
MSDFEQLKSAIAAFSGSGDADETAEPLLRAMRRSLAESLFALEAPQAAAQFNGQMAEAHRLLVASGLRDLPREPAEQELAGRVKRALDAQPAAPGALLAALLLFQGLELSVEEDLRRVPQWLLLDYAGFLLAMPRIFNAPGDARRYHDCTTRAISAIHQYVMHDPELPLASELRAKFVGESSLIQIYFNECNLKEMYRQRAQIFESWAFERGVRLAHSFPLRPAGAAERRLRIGILSNHFGAQTETYFMLAHFERFPRERCTLILYTMYDEATPLSQYARSIADATVHLSVDKLPAAAERIRNEDLDVLLIGSNVTVGMNHVAFLASHRLARTQVICGSSPVTTGFTAADWYLSAQESETEERAQAEYTEDVYRMPGMLTRYAYYLDKDPRTVVLDRADLGIPRNAVVLFSAANYFKVIPELSSTWARIMAQLPQACLLLMPFNRNWSTSYLDGPFSARVLRQIREAGGDPDRVHIIDSMPARADLHGIMSLADVYLDSYPFAGACSLLDPLLVGLPVVARTGVNFRGDVGAGMLRSLGLGDMAVADEQAYIARAIALAKSPDLRKREQERIRAATTPRNPIFDSETGSRNMEAACVDMAARADALEKALMRQPAERLRTALEQLGAELARDGNAWFRALNDVELVRLLVVPYFQSLAEDGRTRRMIDVGACVGQMAAPFLEMGWHADLFEPDPGCRQALADLAGRFGSRAAVHHAVVSDAGADSATFYRSALGLSGLSPSPYGATEATLSVPAVRLDAFTRARKLEQIDFLKIDTEGWDFDALRSHDFACAPARLAMVEFGTEFPRQNMAAVMDGIAEMAGKGYEALVLSYEDNGNYKRQVWRHALIGATFGTPVPRKDGHAAGNIIFFRRDDEVFLRLLFRLLAGFLPPRERQRHYGAFHP